MLLTWKDDDIRQRVDEIIWMTDCMLVHIHPRETETVEKGRRRGKADKASRCSRKLCTRTGPQIHLSKWQRNRQCAPKFLLSHSTTTTSSLSYKTNIFHQLDNGGRFRKSFAQKSVEEAAIQSR